MNILLTILMIIVFILFFAIFLFILCAIQEPICEKCPYKDQCFKDCLSNHCTPPCMKECISHNNDFFNL